MEIIKNLEKRGFKPYFVQNTEDIIKIIKNNIPSGKTIGFGGSMSVDNLEIPQKLKAEGYICNHPKTSDKPWDSICENNRYVDYYISSTNAITKDGILVNTDGRANRISAMCYGPKKLFIIAGINKICENLEDAIKRIEDIAAPLNAKRLNKNTPCAITGKCTHCNSKETICKATLILYHPTSTIDVHVILIDKEIGF